MISIAFYIFAVIGLLFFIYVAIGHALNKKRDKLVKDMEADFEKSRFVKCPECGVLNPKSSKTCDYCKKPLPGAVPKSPEKEKEGAQAPAKPAVPMQGKKPELDSFFFKNPWPVPNTSALISLISFYVIVIFVYAFGMGVYSLGKRGVEQVDEASKKAAAKMSRREQDMKQRKETSMKFSNSRETPSQTAKSSAPPEMPVQSATPIPSPTSIEVTGSPEEQINKLMLFLESENWNVAVQAKEQLVNMGKPAAMALVKEVEHPDAMVRTHVITALGEIAEPETASALIDAADHSDPVTVIQTVTALGNIPAPEVVPHLMKMLDHDDWRVRNAAVLSLKKQNAQQALSSIRKLTNDPNERVSQSASEAVEALSRKD